MKALYKIILFGLALAAASCGKEDAAKDYGFARVYIPQATVTGIDNSYPIPLGPFYQNSKYTCSYSKETGKLDIVVGVIRSGYFAVQQGYSVSLAASASLTAEKVTETGGVALPADVCTIPGTITVPDGESGATVKVSVDLKALSAQRATFYDSGVYKTLVLGLEISNLQGPADYTLADANTSVVILLNLGSEHWDSVPEGKPETEVRTLFPLD
ncbi:MAG: DUF1735 domain-containing protein [Bacteroidales bacterium]|nr:DUF1735 domain-containing protein [Bacteroidales bacterium]